MACQTHRSALPDCPVFEGDVRDLDPPDADVYWASPPCQAWSVGGRRLGAKDLRNGWPWVWDAYDRAAVKPRWLFVENVPGMTHHAKDGHGDPSRCAGCYLDAVVLPNLRARFRHVVARVLDAADFGVPQHRRRLFIVASQQPYRWPTPTHCAPGTLFASCGLASWVTMRQALNLGTQRTIGGGSNPHGPDRAHERKFVELTDRPSTTITAVRIGNAGPWIVGSGRRHLTVAERGVLQGFASDWPWQGTWRSRHAQTGNAVPPALARALVSQVLR